MSTRVRQIKIDEGIEPHLNREIKSEREIQNTLKLKSSYDELILDSNLDEECSSTTSKCSKSHFSPYNSNVPSPTSGILTPSRSFSPSISLSNNNNNHHNNNRTLTGANTSSPSPSPTRKLFMTRQSTSPVVCQLRPSSLSSTKRKRNKACYF